MRLYFPVNEATHCNTLQHTATHIEDTASSASSPPCSLYVHVSVLCVHIVYVCVSKESYENMTFFETNLCLMLLVGVLHGVAACWRRLLQTITFSWWYGCGVATMSRLPKHHVSLAKEFYKNSAHLKKRPRNLGSLKIIATILLYGSITLCIAVCCSVLQCAAVCCSVLQCATTCYSVLQVAAGCCSVLQCVTVCCRLLQCVAVCCSVLQCVAVCCSAQQEESVK